MLYRQLVYTPINTRPRPYTNDYEVLIANSEAMIQISTIRILLKRL